MGSLSAKFKAIAAGGGGAQALAGIGAAVGLVLLIAVIGAFTLGGGSHKKTKVTAKNPTGSAATQTTDTTVLGAPTTDTTLPDTTASTLPGGAPVTGGTATGGTGTGGATPGGSTATTAKPGATTATTVKGVNAVVSTAPGDSTGVTATQIKWGLHAPKTLDGAPLNLAADPLEGVDIFYGDINATMDFGGRKINYIFADDRYTVDGGKAAANTLINDQKVFFAEGTLGVDQIAQVAAEAKKRGTSSVHVPYMAGGGSEGLFKDIGMFQIAASYDQSVINLAKFLGKESKDKQSQFFGKTKVGVSTLDSPYISGPGQAVDAFRKALSANGMNLVKVVTVQKPTEQTSYATQIQDLKSAGTEIFVPTQDPVTTSREVQECNSQACTWLYSFSSFAHDGDVAVSLMGGAWSKPNQLARGLSSGCYYLPSRTPSNDSYDAKKCAKVGVAHDIWVKAKGEQDWVSHGQGGVSGYQVTHFWLSALKSIGTNVTRENMVAALRGYNGYDDLVTGPLSFQGSSNFSHGTDKVAVIEAQVDQKMKMLTPGLVNF